MEGSISNFGRHSNKSGDSGPKEIKNGTVSDIKASPEKGCKRLIVREKSAAARTFAVDIPMKESRKVDRKEAYSFNVSEKEIGNARGVSRQKADSFRTYYCDETPEKYGGSGGKSGFRDFSGSGRLNNSNSRTKF